MNGTPTNPNLGGITAPGSGRRPCIVVAGASGFIGQAIGRVLSKEYRMLGLSRSERKPSAGYDEYRKVDFFSLRDSEAGLAGADFAIYLVHSMMPAARLVQGHFGDLDILCADNFSRAAKSAGVKRIIYISGLIPDTEPLSEHLSSRLEVERALEASGITVVTLRAGMVVGAEGSSYQLLARLVQRLPAMACPSWTQTKMQPIALDDVVRAVQQGLRIEINASKNFDIGTPNPLTYLELMSLTADSLGLKRVFLPLPFLSPGLSRMWVSLTTGAPKDLAAPLIASLKHEMLVRENPAHRLPIRASTSVPKMLEKAAQDQTKVQITPRAFQRTKNSNKASNVCSVQRMKLPEGKDAEWAARTYFQWLPRAMRGLITVRENREEDEVLFIFTLTGHKLLGLKRMPHRSRPDRQVLKVTRGLLAVESERGRLEFRQVLGERVLLASIQEFIPRLPWWIYRSTQGVFHKWVMHRFGRYIAKQTTDNTQEIKV